MTGGVLPAVIGAFLALCLSALSGLERPAAAVAGGWDPGRSKLPADAALLELR